MAITTCAYDRAALLIVDPYNDLMRPDNLDNFSNSQ
jgi:hypothetical protein